MNANRDKGNRAERAVVGYLREHGHPHARRALVGPAADVGDIEGTAAVWEVRDRAQLRIPAWLSEVDAKTVRAGVRFGLLVVKLRGFGAPHAARWPALMRPGTWAALTPNLPPSYAAVTPISGAAGLDLSAVLNETEEYRIMRCAWIGAGRVSLRSGLVVYVTTLQAAASLVPPLSTHDKTNGEQT